MLVIQRRRRLDKRLSHKRAAGHVGRKHQLLRSLLGIQLSAAVDYDRAEASRQTIGILPQRAQKSNKLPVRAVRIHRRRKQQPLPRRLRYHLLRRQFLHIQAD